MNDSPAQERTLEEVKKEVLRRAAHHSPFEGVRRDDVEKIVARSRPHATNPSAMVGAGLLARKAVERGLGRRAFWERARQFRPFRHSSPPLT